MPNATAIVADTIINTANGTVTIQGPPINPVFDANLTPWLPFGISLWLAIEALIIVVIAAILFFAFTRRGKLAPVLGYGVARATAGATEDNYSNVPVILFEKVRTFKILCLKYKDHVLQFPDDIVNIRKWLHGNSDGVLNLGGLRTVVANDDYMWTRDIPAEMALTYGIKSYNAENPDKFKIHDFETLTANFSRLMHFHGVNGIRMPAYGMYDPSETTPLLPMGNDPGTIGGVLLEEARDHDVNAGSPFEKMLAKYGPIGTVFMIGFIMTICLLVMWK